jgi:hypothetical protein
MTKVVWLNLFPTATVRDGLSCLEAKPIASPLEASACNGVVMRHGGASSPHDPLPSRNVDLAGPRYPTGSRDRVRGENRNIL